MKLYEIDNLIKEVCPIYGVNSDGVIFFCEDSTEEQKAAAREIMNDKLPLLEGI